MKTKNNIAYYITLIAAFLIVAAGIITTALCGINLGFNEAGGTQISVKLEAVTKDQAKTAVVDVLKENNLKIDTMFVEDKELSSLLVINVAKKDIANINEVCEAIANKLGISADNCSYVAIKSTIKSNTYLVLGIVLICLTLAIFLFGLIRYKLYGGLTLAFAFLAQLMLSLSICFCTRIELTLGGIVSILAGSILATLLTVVMLEKYRERIALKSLANGDEKEIMGATVKSTLEPIFFTIGSILLVAIIMLFTGVRRVMMMDFAIIISLAVMAANLLIIVPSTLVSLAEINRVRLENHLSKNNSPAPSKKK